VSNRLPTADEAILLLEKIGCSNRVIRHCEAVAKLALGLAEKCASNGLRVDKELTNIGALLHDIGRSKTHGVHHVAVGAEIARSLNMHPSVVAIIERHVGGGITADEASELGWESKSYMPETIEEKIVAYADKLIQDAEVVPIEKTIRNLRRRLGPNHPALERVTKLHEEITRLCR